MSTVEILVKVVDESTAELKKVEAGFKDLEKTTEKFIGVSKKVEGTFGKTGRTASEQAKAFIEAGKSSKGFTTDIIKAEEEITKLWMAQQEAARTGGEFSDSQAAILENFKKGNVGLQETVADIEAYNAALAASKEKQEAFQKEQGEAGKGSDDLKKKLTGLAKGFLGITGAIVAGRAIAKFGKDSLAAAKAAGRLPPIFAEIERTSANLKEEFGVELGRSLEPVLGLVEDLGSRWAEDLRIVNEYNAAVAKGVISQEQLNDALGTGTTVTGLRELTIFDPQNKERLSNDEKRAFLAEKQAKFTKAQNFELEIQLRAEKSVLGATVDIQRAYAANRDLLALTNEDLDEMAVRQLAINRFAELGDFNVSQRTGLRQISDDPIGSLAGVDTGILGAIQQEQDRIEFLKAGGQEVLDTFARLLEQIDNNETSMESYELSLQKAEIRALAVAAAVGQITLDAAAKELMDDLNISYAEALALLQNINTQLDSIDGRKATAIINIVVKGGIAGEIGVRTGGILENFTPKARGGNFSAGEGILVGEEGPELLVPRGAGTVVPNNQIGSSGNSGNGNAGMEAGFAALGKDFKDGMMDLKQAIVEAG